MPFHLTITYRIGTFNSQNLPEFSDISQSKEEKDSAIQKNITDMQDVLMAYPNFSYESLSSYIDA